MRRSVLHLAALLALLAILGLPLAAMADSCTDCFGADSAGSADCCGPSCCACCVHGPLATSSLAKMAAGPAPSSLAGHPAPVSGLSSFLRDVFHVPKRSLA